MKLLFGSLCLSVLVAVAVLSGCTPPASVQSPTQNSQEPSTQNSQGSQDPSDPQNSQSPTGPQTPPVSTPHNIANQVLPGDWQVVGHTTVFSFDGQGVPVSISNPADPSDPATNMVFDQPNALTGPGWRATVQLVPGTPYIDSDTLQATFGATGTVSNLVLYGLPMFGQGTATYSFTGQYDPSRDQLAGHSETKALFGPFTIYSSSSDSILQKLP